MIFIKYINLNNYFIVFSEGDSEDSGLLRSEIITWYLEKIEDQIEDESELLEKKSFIEKILDRLIYNVSHLLNILLLS